MQVGLSSSAVSERRCVSVPPVLLNHQYYYLFPRERRRRGGNGLWDCARSELLLDKTCMSTSRDMVCLLGGMELHVIVVLASAHVVRRAKEAAAAWIQDWDLVGRRKGPASRLPFRKSGFIWLTDADGLLRRILNSESLSFNWILNGIFREPGRKSECWMDRVESKKGREIAVASKQ